MSEASFASLGPTLLARKGGAKPAMRPQLAPLPEVVAAEQLEDLGWNDMGQDEIDQDEVVEVKAPANESGADIVSIKTKVAPEADPVVVKAPKKRATKSKTKTKSSTAAKTGRRAAFTLRLDADRHLKLRLASTMQGVSAQALVTEALDAMLAEIDDLDALASRMKRN